jgi:hypothetical protein
MIKLILIGALGEKLQAGQRVVLYMTDECEVQATLQFDGIWLGCPDWSTIQYY